MADLHNLGSYNTLEEVWKLLPYGGCPGDYVYIAGEQIYWNEYRSVWGNPDAAVSTDPEQTINGDLTVTKDLTVGEHTLGDTAKYNSLEVDNIIINSNPFADKDHDHDLKYSKIGHTHDYAPKSHRHNVNDIDGLGEVQGGGNVDIVTDYDTDIPSNANVPSMLRLLKELAENNEILTEYFLRKDYPDTASELITFLKGSNYGTWSQGSTGAAIYQDEDGNWHFEADFMNIRKKITATEIEIMEASHIGGILNLTGASMRCIKVEDTADSYRCFMRLEDSDGNRVYNQWKVGDQAFVETFNLTRQADGKLGNHYLWRLVTAVGEDYIDLSKTIAGEGSDVPLAGDKIVLLGYQGTDDPNRQNAMILAGAGVGSPYLKQYTGINSFTLPKEEIRLKPGDNLLMGDLYTQDGQSVKTQLTVLDDKISAEVSSVRDDLAKDTSLLNNPNFNLMNYWQTDNEVKLLTASGKWIFVNNKLFGRKKAFAGVTYDGSRTALFIRNKYILQLNDNLIAKPTFEKNAENLYIPEYFYIKFYYRVKKAGTLAILFDGEDKTGWVPYNSISVVTALSESDTYQTFETGGQWNGTGNFKLSFTGEIYLYGVVLAKDRVASLEEKSAGWLTEADGVKIWAASEITMSDGTKVKASSLFNVTADGIFLKSDNIKLEGVVTANENFRIREDGSIETQNAKLSGYLYSKFIDVVSSDAILQPDNSYLLNTNLNLDVSHNNIKLPVSEEYMGARVLLMDSHFIVTRVPQPPTKIETEDGSYITSGLFDGSNFMYKGIIIDAGTVELTLKRLLTGYTESGDEIYEYRWVLINCSAKTLTPYN